jgi:hypothetical protein
MQNNNKKSPKPEEASTQSNKLSPKQEEGPTQDCIICAYPIEGKERLRTLTTCEHTEPICSICFLRIRALQRNFHCPTCKREIDNVICTEIGEKSHFNDYQITPLTKLSSSKRKDKSFSRKSIIRIKLKNYGSSNALSVNRLEEI